MTERLAHNVTFSYEVAVTTDTANPPAIYVFDETANYDALRIAMSIYMNMRYAVGVLQVILMRRTVDGALHEMQKFHRNDNGTILEYIVPRRRSI